MFAVIWFGTPHSPFKRACGGQGALRRTRPRIRQSLRRTRGARPQHRRAAPEAPRPENRGEHAARLQQRQRRPARKSRPRPRAACAASRALSTKAGCACPAIIEWPGGHHSRASRIIPPAPWTCSPPSPTCSDCRGTSSPSRSMARASGRSSRRSCRSARSPSPSTTKNNPPSSMGPTRSSCRDQRPGHFEVYDLVADFAEAHDLAAEKPELTARLRQQLLATNESIEASFAGHGLSRRKTEPARLALRRLDGTPQLRPLSRPVAAPLGIRGRHCARPKTLAPAKAKHPNPT